MNARLAWLLIVSLLILAGEALAFEKRDLDRLVDLQKRKKYCEASLLASRCLADRTVDHNLDRCLYIGENVTLECLFEYSDKVFTPLQKKGQLAQIEKLNIQKFDKLKLEKRKKIFVYSTELYEYSNDYAKRHVELFKTSRYREEMLLVLVSHILWHLDRWEAYVRDFEKEFPNSKDMSYVQCLLGEYYYSHWAYENLDLSNRVVQKVRADSNSAEAKQLRERALSYLTKVKNQPPTRTIPHCEIGSIDEALKHLSQPGIPPNPIGFFLMN
ncbi:hypothetical protein [Oligoflexus tunisiensis]|uniref:hypothetical protein n=1 Tax=Oligoflexus tunisiensis TaxID=708132 RepID=UPI00114D238F|nr:hypothetical protein [Oligoflexus tunisiensis]